MQIYDTHDLLQVVQGLDPFEPFLLNMFFTKEHNSNKKKLDFDLVAEDARLAPFVSPMVAGKAMRSKGGETRTFEPAYLKPLDVVDPDRVLLRRPGEPIGGTQSPEQRRRAIIADILDSHRKQIQRRREWMAAQALLTGKVVVSGEDYPEQEVDFQRDAGNTIVLAGGNVWTDTTDPNKPLAQIEAWNDQAEAPITDLIMDSGAWTLLYAFQGVKDLLESRRGSESKLELGPDNEKWVQYKGILGSYRVWVYKGYYKDDADVKHNFIPTNTVIAASAAVDGVRAHGAILDPKAGYQAMAEFPKDWVNDNPAVEQVMTQSAPLMIPARVNASVAVTVG
ncbi:MAG: major capsid protein [Candidatus Thiodiazotropha sp. (ex Monitilora ramsayi)]|nr:major capsid protein [Candidatus Thiodiazotropha sp. (ex Monitilora ramsayi)]